MGLFGVKKISELELYLERIQSNMANNYKDNAQDYYQKFETKLDTLIVENKLSEKQKMHYEKYRMEYGERLKGFTHKDQKPYWT